MMMKQMRYRNQRWRRKKTQKKRMETEEGRGNARGRKTQHSEEHVEEDWSSEEEGPSSRKRMKTNNEVENINLEVKRKVMVTKDTLFVSNVLGQVISQTVTNAFVQVKKDTSLSGWMIPGFGCTRDEIYLFMYDPEEDILLQHSKLINLWVPTTNKFDLDSVIIIWLFLNFKLFVKPDISKMFQLRKSMFHSLASEVLEIYKEGMCRERFETCFSGSYADFILSHLNTIGVQAKRVSEIS